MSIDTSGTTTPYDSKSTLNPASPSADAESGAGGGDMLYWTALPDDTQLERISGTYSSEASYFLPLGVASISYNKQETKPKTPDEFVEDGRGGEHLSVWSASRQEQFDTLMAGNYTDESSYGIPAGVLDASGYSSFRDGEYPIEEPNADSVGGDGGGDMSIWNKSRTEKLDAVAKATNANLSKYPTPKGVRGTGSYSDFKNGEVGLGTTVEGQATAPNGLPLEGSVDVFEDGERVTGASVFGSFTVAHHIGETITSGSPSDGIPEIDLEFTPVADGISVKEEGVNWPTPDYLGVTYGYVSGQVTDYEGNPVEDVTVRGRGASTTSDEDGMYYLIVPGTTTLSLESLEGTVEKTVQTERLQTTYVDWQFGGLRVSVEGPKNRPVQDAPVTINGEQMFTDAAGSVLVPDLPLGTAEATIMGEYDVEFDILDEGQLRQHTHDGGSRLRVVCIDKSTGDAIRGVMATNRLGGARSRSGDGGELSLLALSGGEFQAVVGANDDRYHTSELTEEVETGQEKTVSIELEPKTTVTNV